MKTRDIYIACPSNCYTGGPTLLHQLCQVLQQQGLNARMAYYHGVGSEQGDPVHRRYKGYGCCFVMLDDVHDDSDSWLIVPETAISKLDKFCSIQKAVWWLSVDNYIFGNLSVVEKVRKRIFKTDDVQKFINGTRVAKRDVFNNDKILHFVQSEYARLFLKSMGVSSKRIYRLSDYLEGAYLDVDLSQSLKREDLVLYNPKKMGKVVKALIGDPRERIAFVALEGLNSDELIQLMKRAKVYVDFGPHPGKDRLPREAALCGCCIITGLKGSSGNDIDVPIPKEYKLPDSASAHELAQLINHVFSDYETCIEDFQNYRALIDAEKLVFENDVALLGKTLFDRGCNG